MTRFTLFVAAMVLMLPLVFTPTAQGEGIAGASFEKDCLPELGDQPEMIRALSALEIQPIGNGLLSWRADGSAYTGFPMRFAARPRGSKGPYLITLLFHRLEMLESAASIMGGAKSGTMEGEGTKIGLTMWQRPVRTDDVEMLKKQE